METRQTPDRRWLRRAGALAAAGLMAFPVVPVSPAVAAPSPAVETQAEAAQREREALHDLEESSAAVRDAGVALQRVATQLPKAQADVARARGELAGARAKLASANAAVARAERARAAAERRVEAANDKVEQSRRDVASLARRAYQRGRLGDLREVMEAGEPQDVVERASMLRAVFKHQDASLQRLTRDRLSLARTEAGLEADERAVSRARARAQEGEARAREVTVEAESAAARVADLVEQRKGALAAAERGRAADERAYAEAQAASRALAARIREAARRAAAAEAKRRAEAAAAERRAAAAGRPSRRREAAPTTERTGNMLWPCRGCPMTSRYGYRTHPIYGTRRFHAGVDMGASTGTSALASDGGTVIFAGDGGGYGNLVVISHGTVGGRDLSTAYAHLSSFSVREGQRVSKGQRVGGIGSTGNSTGPHLHFEVRRGGDPVDPLDYVDPP